MTGETDAHARFMGPAQAKPTDARRPNVHVIEARTIREHSRERQARPVSTRPGPSNFCCLVAANRGWVCKPATEAKFHDDRYTGAAAAMRSTQSGPCD